MTIEINTEITEASGAVDVAFRGAAADVLLKLRGA
jgi:hypothetical protein